MVLHHYSRWLTVSNSMSDCPCICGSKTDGPQFKLYLKSKYLFNFQHKKKTKTKKVLSSPGSQQVIHLWGGDVTLQACRGCTKHSHGEGFGSNNRRGLFSSNINGKRCRKRKRNREGEDERGGRVSDRRRAGSGIFKWNQSNLCYSCHQSTENAVQCKLFYSLLLSSGHLNWSAGM